MRFANLAGRLSLVLGEAFDRACDVAEASGGRFGPDPMSAFDDWTAFADWASSWSGPTAPFDPAELRCPVPAPRQVFGIGLNYRTHAQESGMDIPEFPATFTKFPASLAGPFDDIEIMGDAIDWEAELVAVIGTRADRIVEADGWNHVAALTVGQDISDRKLQFAAGGQFSLGKSRRGYGPMGPWLVTPDELPDRDAISLGCSVDGESMQDANTSDLIFSIPRLVSDLSSVMPLLPGDVIFTGTPAGIGIVRKPPITLQPGKVLETWVDGIGTMRNVCVAPEGV